MDSFFLISSGFSTLVIRNNVAIHISVNKGLIHLGLYLRIVGPCGNSVEMSEMARLFVAPFYSSTVHGHPAAMRVGVLGFDWPFHSDYVA